VAIHIFMGKSTPLLRVEWDEKPQNWMRDGAMALDAALRQNAPSSPINEVDESDDVLVFRICVFKDRVRRNAIVKDVRRDNQDRTDIQMVASPMVKVLSPKLTMNWSLLKDLKEKRHLNKLLALVGVFIVCLTVFDPAQHRFKRQDPHDPKNTIDVVKSHHITQIARTLCLLAGFFIALENVSVELLKHCITNFDVLVITLSAATCEIFVRLELFDVYENLSTAAMMIEVSEAMARVMVHWVCAIMDAWSVSNVMKVVITVLFWIDLAFLYLTNRYLRDWSSHKPCNLLTLSCTTRDDWYLSARSQELLFVSKILVDYVCGHRFAVLKPRFMDPFEKNTFFELAKKMLASFNKKRAGTATARNLNAVMSQPATGKGETIHTELPYEHKGPESRNPQAFVYEETSEETSEEEHGSPGSVSDGCIEFEAHLHVHVDPGDQVRAASQPRDVVSEQETNLDIIEEEPTMALSETTWETHPPYHHVT